MDRSRPHGRRDGGGGGDGRGDAGGGRGGHRARARGGGGGGGGGGGRRFLRGGGHVWRVDIVKVGLLLSGQVTLLLLDLGHLGGDQSLVKALIGLRRVDDLHVAPDALAKLAAHVRPREAPVAEVTAVFFWRDHLDDHVNLFAREDGGGARERHGHLAGHLIAAHKEHARARRPWHLAHVLEAPDLREGGAGRHLGAVEDGHVAHKARGELGALLTAHAVHAAMHASVHATAAAAAAA